MAKIKVINSNLNGNLNGSYFNDTPSNTIFSFGRFFVTSNFDGKTNVDYTNTLSSFVRPVTLETMGVTDVQSEILEQYSTKAVLNLDKSDLNTFVRYGSAYEFLRVSIQNIILAYPASLFANSQANLGGNPTFSGLTYDEVTNISTFYVPISSIVNKFGIVYNNGNTSVLDNNELKNLNISFNNYVIWSTLEPNKLFSIIGYTGNTINHSNFLYRDYLKLEVSGNPFSLLGTGNTGNFDFHIRPNNVIFEEFRALLNSYEQNIVSRRDDTNGFIFTLKTPTLLDDGKIIYSDSQILWNTGDKYNIDIDTPSYQRFLNIVLTIGSKYDAIKTDLIARFLTPSSIKTYDFTEEGKISKLLKVYGYEFDQIRQFIDSLVYINKVTYDKINNIPDQLVKNLANTFGWDYFSLVNESELIEGFLTVDDTERNLNEDILPAEIDVELWRRILNNTNYFWKSKGTRQAIKSMFLLIGIPEPFINITEYVYTVDGKINPNTVALSQADFPSNSLPYDNSGYPIAPLETNDFYFQMSGNTDSGQAYLNAFRMAGFNLSQTVDNKKSWIQTGSTNRVHSTTPQYHQEDSKLVINTKEIDIALDTARGIEYDVFDYIKNTDFPANSSGYTLPYSYVNISLGITGSQSTFQLPVKTQGDFEVRYNGILLNAPKTGMTTGITYQSDYSVDFSANTFTINNPAYNINNRRDVIQATYVYSGYSAITGITVNYIVTRVNANLAGTYIQLPSYPRGDVQLTINGIALTKGTAQFTADYILDPANTTGSSQIIIQNPDVITYLNANPDVQISYMEVHGSNDINLRSEVIRVDSFNSSKIYFNNSANKYVYKLNYRINNVSEVKFLVDGIALEPIKDYNVNVMNPYEIFLPKGIRYGSVLSAYYLVGGNSVFTPIISDSWGLGDISQLSFLEFIELIQRKMVNARNRKTITDFKGGWYPALLRIYEMYLERADLEIDDPLRSNGYNFQNLYPFLGKYNAFFQRFVDQLLSSTIIVRKGGLLIRNSVFTKQKFTYKRGVNLYAEGSVTLDMRGNSMLYYLGNDGSQFQIKISTSSPTAILPTVNIDGVSDITETSVYVSGGVSSDGGAPIIGYGFIWATHSGVSQLDNLIDLGSGSESQSFDFWLDELSPNTPHYIVAFASNSVGISLSDEIMFETLPIQLPLTPSGKTIQNTSSTPTSLVNTGGYDIQRYEDISWYGMQYSAVSSTSAFNVSPSIFTDISDSSTTCNVNIVGETTNYYTASATTSWLIPETPVLPTPFGISQSIFVCENSGIARTGCTVYTPTIGTPQIVEFRQNSVSVTSNAINVTCIGGINLPSDTNQCGQLIPTTPMTSGQCYTGSFNWFMNKLATAHPVTMSVQLLCNTDILYSCNVESKNLCNCSGSWSGLNIDNNDVVCLVSCVVSSSIDYSGEAGVDLTNIIDNVGDFNIGSPTGVYSSVGLY